MTENPTPAALLLSGGLALGAYQAGAIAALISSGKLNFTAVAGSSIGAFAAVIIAGNPPERRVEALNSFWIRVANKTAKRPWNALLTQNSTFQSLESKVAALVARTQGVNGLFFPHLRLSGLGGGPGLYNSAPALNLLEELVDFELLNSGAVRCCIAATDIETCRPVWFDTGGGDIITPDHVRASGGLLPNFPSVQIEGRSLGDGGLSVNAPLEPFLSSQRTGPLPDLMILLDLFSAGAPPPESLERALERSTDVMYSAQTLMRLDALVRERSLEARLSSDSHGTDLLYLSYLNPKEGAGPEKTFDFSTEALTYRMAAGERDAQLALDFIGGVSSSEEPGLRVHTVGLGSASSQTKLFGEAA